MKSKNQLRHFTYFIASYHCLLENNFIQYNKFSLYLIHLISEFQIFGMIVLNLKYQNLSFPLMNIGFIINSISYISRPYAIFNQEIQFFQYSYLIPLITLVLYFLHQAILLFTFQRQNSKSLTEFILRSNNAQQILHWIFIIFFSLFDKLFSVPFLEFAGISISINIGKNTFGVVEFTNTIFAIFSIILIILAYTLHFMIIKETITLQIFNFKVLILTASDYIINLLILILIFIETFYEKGSTKNYLSIIFYLLISFLKINSLVTKYQHNHYIQIFLVRLSICLLFITIVFACTLQINDQKIVIVIYILVTSLAMTILNEVKQNFDFRRLINLEEGQKTQTMQYLITVFANKEKLSQIENICFVLFLSNHKLNCEDKLCICQKGHYLENEQKLKQLFLKYLILNFGKSINKLTDQGQKGYFSLFYIQGLITINQSVKAYQQTNILLLKQTINQINEQKNVFSEQTTYSMTVDENQNVLRKKSNSELVHKLEKISIQQLNYINQLKISIILEIAKQNLIQSFSFGNVMQKNQLSLSVQLYMKVEEQHQQLKSNIINILNKKKDVFIAMQSTTKINPERFLQQCMELIFRINNMENELTHLFQEFPSKKMQSIFSFYCAEILNNFLQAFKIVNYNAISDNALIKIQKNYTVDLLTTQLHYMILVMDHQGTGLQIVESSSQMHKLIQYEQQEFKEIRTILTLLPKGFQIIHKHLIEDFLIYGKSKFFREQNINFILQKDQFLKPCDFFFDFDLTKLQELTFQVFFSDLNCNNSYILLNNKNAIIGITKEFCKQLKLQDYEYDQLPEFLFHTEIQQLFPEYFQLVDMNRVESNQSFGNVQFIFVELNSQNNKSFQSYIEQKKKNTDIIKQYIATIVVQIKRTHTIIEIKNLIETKKSIQLQQEDMDDLFIEEVAVNNEFHIPQPKQFNYDLFPKMLSEIQNNNQEEYFIQNEISGNVDQLETNRILALQQRQLISESMQQYDLISPGRSHRQLIDRSACPSNQMNFSYQQKFFQKYVEEKEKDKDQSQDYQSDQIKLSAKNQMENYQNAEIRENLKQLLNDENQTSLFAKKVDIENAAASSTLGTFSQNFQLYKKYELLQQIVTSQNFSVMFDVMIFTLTIVALVSIIFAILLINNSNTDIYSSLSQMQMLEFYFAYMSPQYTFLSSYTSLKNYQNGKFEAEYDLIIDNLIRFNEYQIGQSYLDMKSSYSNLSYGDLLQDDISQTQIPFINIKEKEVTSTEFSLREGIFQTLQYQYMFQYYFLQKQLDDMQLEQLISYLLNMDQLDESIFNINSEIITYINDNHVILQHKWIVMCVRCIYLVLLFQLSAWLLYIKHIRKFSKILKLFLKVDVVWISRDLERCKELINFLNKDSDLVFRYKFNIMLKERFFKNELLKKHIILEKISQAGIMKQDSKQKLLLRRTPSFLLFTSLFFIFFLFAFIINQQAINFMDYYQIKSFQYNSIGQLGLSAEKMYSLREIIYFKNEKADGYDYIDQNKTEKYLASIKMNMDIMSNFLQTYTVTDGEFYDDSLLALNNQSLCEIKILSQSLTSQQLSLCNQIYDGVLQRGLSITFTKIRDIFATEINTSMEFSIRNNPPFNEIEIGIYLNLLIMDVLQEIKLQLLTLADQLNLTIQAISIIYLILTSCKLIIILLFIRNSYVTQFQNIKKLTILLPQAALFIDDLFERQIRQIIAKEHLA